MIDNFINGIVSFFKKIFQRPVKELPTPSNQIENTINGSKPNSFQMEMEKYQSQQYLLNLQSKLMQNKIKEEDLDETEYVELELLYKEQIKQLKNRINAVSLNN